MTSPKTLFLDCETSPVLATVWGLFKQNIAINQLVGNSEVLTWCAKWKDSRVVLDGSLLRDGKKRMLKKMHKLLAEADEVVTWNGDGFDLKVMNKEFLLLGLTSPAPFKSVDLLKTARQRFRFTSNKLDYVSQQLGCGSKVKHSGHSLWIRCMNREPKAFEEMLRYNRKDVILLEKVYDRFFPWIKGGVNRSVHSGNLVCPKCGGRNYQRRGILITQAGEYERFQCQARGCGKWFRGTKNLGAKRARYVEVA